jgi:hypothetical protein
MHLVRTDISYAVVMPSSSSDDADADADAITAAVTERLQQRAVMAQVLSAATGSAVSEDDVETTEQVQAPAASGDSGGSSASGGDGVAIKLQTGTVVMVCAFVGVVALCGCLIVWCKKKRRRRATAGKSATGGATAIAVGEGAGVWMEEEEQWPGGPPAQPQPLLAGASVVPAVVVSVAAPESHDAAVRESKHSQGVVTFDRSRSMPAKTKNEIYQDKPAKRRGPIRRIESKRSVG